jgi:SAM-dependent methyltransferase
MIDRKALIEADIIHDEDHERNRARLDGFYGRVARRQNELIVRQCRGPEVLDVGAGYGTLTRQLVNAGFVATALEVDEEKARLAFECSGVRLQLADFYTWPAESDSFETIVFREVLNHLDLPRAFARARELTRNRVIVFQGTEIPALRLAKRCYGHEEYHQKRPADLLAGLRAAGFRIREQIYSDVLAFPASGGFHGHCVVPPVRGLENMILGLDRVLTSTTKLLGLERHLCFRLLIVAEK